LGLSLSGIWGGRTGPEAEAVVAGFQDVAVVGEAIQQGGRHLGITEDTGPLAEVQIGGEAPRRLLRDGLPSSLQHPYILQTYI